MGTLLDTTVFIELERELNRLPVDRAMLEMAARLERELGANEEVGMAAIRARSCSTECIGRIRPVEPGGRPLSRPSS